MRRLCAIAITCTLTCVPILDRAGAQGARGRADSANLAGSSAAAELVAASGHTRTNVRLNDSIWTRADSITDLRQRDPYEGQPASERTVVKVVRGADALFVLVRAYDRAPADIRATQLRRDADLTSDDYVTLMIDSFHDRRSAFLFRTNPNGAMWDAQMVDADSWNADWNGIWDVTTSRESTGWTAEFRIPFQTLRFRAGRGASFGFNVERFIRRRNEQDLWQAWSRRQGLMHLEAEGQLGGLGDMERAHAVEVRPYVLSRAVASEHDSVGDPLSNGSVGGRVGLDVKAALTPTLTADLTTNTDFAQVEVDQQVINLTRFPTFFPEKRDFFLEGSGIFDFGTSGYTQLFYSRRIGLDTLGNIVPILGGARVTGRAGAWTLGALDVHTGGLEQANDAVIRLKHDLFARSYVGGMFMNRSGPGLDGAERAGGLDATFPLVLGGRNVVPAVWAAGTQTPGAAGTPMAWRLSTDYPNDLFDNFVSVYHIDRGFSPSLGFVRRTGIWETVGHSEYMPRPGVFGIRQLFFEWPIPNWDIIANENGSLTDSRTWQTADVEWRLFGGDLMNGDHFGMSLQRHMDAPTEAFAVFRDVTIAPGRYWWTRGELLYNTSPGRPLSASTDVTFGNFYGGRSTDVSFSGAWRGGGHVIVGVAMTRTDAVLPSGRFTAVQVPARLEYAFNTRADFLGFVQLNNETRRADFNLRFHWIPKIGDDVYVVWNSGYTTEPDSPYRFPTRRMFDAPLNGALVVKAVHRFTP